MVSVNSKVLILSTLAHVLDRLKAIDSRLIDIEDAVVTATDNLAAAAEDVDVEIDMDDDRAAALADQILDAADDIEYSAAVPNHELIASKLREIAEMLAQ